ncbi:MAG: N-acetyl-gamma-glutamyl-phosphate reductase [Actinomycetota bacterium]|nr:N-acetyl-gamma-glutamyl-phosphate reductase [Actinomycetota bacterium]
MVRTGIVGASGYAGAELLRLCLGHPGLDLAWVTGDTSAGTPVRSLYPNLAAVVGELTYEPWDPTLADGLDLVFLALPHGASSELMADLIKRAAVVVDLAADFRLRDPELYPRWYGHDHVAPELLDRFAYGLPELFRDDLGGARAVAVPGCYPTAAALALAPFVRAGAVEPSGIVVDAASGVSGAGRGKYPFCGTDEDFRAYGLLDHRHTPEIEQATGASVLFTPHLAPMNRGILATCYARPTGATSTGEVLDLLRRAYDGEPFVVVSADPPSTAATAGSNCAHLTARFDERTGWVVVLAALDNLVKGAAGQAVQCANLALGEDEATGLPLVGMLP